MTVLAACGGARDGGAIPASAPMSVVRNAHSGAPGPILTTSDGGQIFDFDIDQHGNDGILTSNSSSRISVQTFDQRTGAITKTFGVHTGTGPRNGDGYVANGIFAGDVALVDYQKAGIPGQTPAHDTYRVIDPAANGKFTGKWKPSAKLFNVLQHAVNQGTTTSVLFGYQRLGSDPTELIVSDIANGMGTKAIALDQQSFFLSDNPQLAQDTVHNRAIMATSPSAGAAGGPPPVIVIIDLMSGKASQFSGVSCPGIEGCGYANGIGYDSKTGRACTTTELDGGAEFYDVAKQTGIRVPLPNDAGQVGAGSYVASDSVHQLFLIAQEFSSTGPPSTSSIQVYREDGTFVESIDGLNFTHAGFDVIPTRIALNPRKRIGWVNAANFNQLQQFSY
ncbi:MAG TPA: hypothetical protein VGF86_06160 [Candidatus Tumulicola sp.]